MENHKPRVRQIYGGMDQPPMYQGRILNNRRRELKTPFYNSVKYCIWHLADIKKENNL